MKRIRFLLNTNFLFTLLAGLTLITACTGQIYDPVKWKYSSEKVSDKEYTLLLTATIEEHWHLYSQFLDNDDGPIATSFQFDKSSDYELVGKVEEGKPIKEYDPNFEMDLKFFENKAVFKQKVKVKKEGPLTIKGTLEFMVCNQEMCLPPEQRDFEITINEEKTTDQVEVDQETNPEEQEQNQEPNNDNGGIEEPVVIDYEVTKLEENKYQFDIKAKIGPGWHFYSQNLPSQDGPVATEITFNDSTAFKTNPKAEEVGVLVTHFDPMFSMDLNYFENEVTFRNIIEKTGDKDIIEGEIYYMVCNESQCLPPTPVAFRVDLQNLTVTDPNEELETTITQNEGSSKYLLNTVELDNPVQQCGATTGSNDNESSMWGIFILGFIGGLLALLTPCVFPMIPLTVSFFTKGSSDRKKGVTRAITYAFFIFFIYVLLSIPFHLFDQIDPNILNNIATNIWLNLFFFVIFIVFAISFFGYFEITMPSKFTNKMDSASNVGGLIGIFFMALTLALVSFSCTGPILGSLLAGSLSAEGGAMQLTAGMGGFGLALALPFGLFAAFPGLLNALPQSGGWLNSVKVVLGFVELALAVKFLSNADLVEHWGILKIEAFLGLWIVIGLGLALYLLGLIKFPHDSPVTKRSLGKIGFTLAVLSFVAYLGSGFRYNEKTHTFTSLTLLSGLAPPAGYSWIYPNECPLNLNCFHDYDEGLAYAKKTNKPIMIDFTGYACVNCRKMEEHVWSKPNIFKLLNEDYVLISLYVDDRKELPDSLKEVYETSQGRKKKIETYGDKWATFQTETFANNSQPWYVLLSPDEKLLNKPQGNTPNVDEYHEFLQCGLDGFKSLNQTAEK